MEVVHVHGQNYYDHDWKEKLNSVQNKLGAALKFRVAHCLHTHTHILTHTYSHTHTHTHPHILTHTYTHLLSHTHMNMNIYVINIFSNDLLNCHM